MKKIQAQDVIDITAVIENGWVFDSSRYHNFPKDSNSQLLYSIRHILLHQVKTLPHLDAFITCVDEGKDKCSEFPSDAMVLAKSVMNSLRLLTILGYGENTLQADKSVRFAPLDYKKEMIRLLGLLANTCERYDHSSRNPDLLSLHKIALEIWYQQVSLFYWEKLPWDFAKICTLVRSIFAQHTNDFM